MDLELPSEHAEVAIDEFGWLMTAKQEKLAREYAERCDFDWPVNGDPRCIGGAAVHRASVYTGNEISPHQIAKAIGTGGQGVYGASKRLHEHVQDIGAKPETEDPGVFGKVKQVIGQ